MTMKKKAPAVSDAERFERMRRLAQLIVFATEDDTHSLGKLLDHTLDLTLDPSNAREHYGEAQQYCHPLIEEMDNVRAYVEEILEAAVFPQTRDAAWYAHMERDGLASFRVSHPDAEDWVADARRILDGTFGQWVVMAETTVGKKRRAKAERKERRSREIDEMDAVRAAEAAE
jgi:hypothetical protein